MSQDPKTLLGSANKTAAEKNTTTPTGKATAAIPKLTGTDHSNDRLEMADIMAAGPPQLKPEDDIMQLARVGHIPGIQKLFEEGTFDPLYCDAEGITPLHWAAINNQYAMCQFLIDAGAEVNKKGGESVATPAMWAAQRCHYYVVNLLLNRGADPLITDVQGYNILHLATFEGNVMLLVMLLHNQAIEVDVLDAHQHTSLMWAAYKGFPACVDLFLRWGANIHAVDENGFTALHWALVKGSPGCIQKLIEYGADRFAETKTGKTPAITADEMKTTAIWHRALQECGFDDDGKPVLLEFPMSSYLLKDKRQFFNRFFFFWPFLTTFVMMLIGTSMVVYAAIPFALLAGYGLQYVAGQLMPYAPSDMRAFAKTPWLAGIFAASLFFVGLRYLTTVLPATYSLFPVSNLVFATAYSMCGYFYFTAMAEDPGFVPKLGGLTQQKAVIDELLSLWKFDTQNFCVTCMVRQPLRSKHCKKCDRCVAKHDHHCPWVYNCIGVNNHRHFMYYLLTLVVGLVFNVKLVISYYQNMPQKGSTECNILAPDLCALVNADAYTLVLTVWGAAQLTWISMLLFVQLTQISRAVTTWENMTGAHADDPSSAITNALVAGTTTLGGAQLGHSGHGPDPVGGADGHGHGHSHGHGHGHHHHKHQSCFSQWKRLLGVDTFVDVASQGYSGSRRNANRNPFSAGVLTNCQEFWFDATPVFGERETGVAKLGGELVNYTMMYETPRLSNRRHTQAAGPDGAGTYSAVAADDSV